VSPPVTVHLEPWDEPVAADDPHANFKEEVALWSKADPMETLEPFSRLVGLPVGAVARYVLAKWAGEGSAALLELGPSALDRLWGMCEQAEAAPDDAARLAAYRALGEVIGWMRLPPRAEDL
jgi:hypothetical protein